MAVVQFHEFSNCVLVIFFDDESADPPNDIWVSRILTILVQSSTEIL